MNEDQITALERLASLRDSGSVSAQEFEALKAEILNPNQTSAPTSAPMPASTPMPTSAPMPTSTPSWNNQDDTHWGDIQPTNTPMPTSAPTSMGAPTPTQRPTPPQGAPSSPRSAAQSADFATLASRAAALPRWVKLGVPIVVIAIALKVFGGGTGNTSGSEASENGASTNQSIDVQSGRGVMPDVTCMDLQSAQDRIQELTDVFFVDSQDATGQGRSQVIDSNWQVVSQRPIAGADIGDTPPMLSVVKFGEEPDLC
jgi:hypothetical protein